MTIRYQDILGGFDPASSDPKSTAPTAYQLPSPWETKQADEDEDDSPNSGELVAGPSMQFTRETWWEALLTLYASGGSGSDLGDVMLTSAQRISITQHIFRDLRALLRASVYWASFLHLPRFFETLLDPVRRKSIQPGLLLSMLAIGAHVQSSELQEGERGRKRGVRLLEQAHAALQASLSSNWVDVGLVQAAWVSISLGPIRGRRSLWITPALQFIAYYEMQSPPGHNYDRLRSSMFLLDSLIRLLSLNTLDAGLPGSEYSVFATSNHFLADPTHAQPTFYDGVHGPGEIGQPGCECAKFTLKKQWPNVSDIAPLWGATTIWPDELPEGEIRKEEARRVVWSSIMLVAGHAGYASAEAQLEKTDLFIKDYHNVCAILAITSLIGAAC